MKIIAAIAGFLLGAVLAMWFALHQPAPDPPPAPQPVLRVGTANRMS